jgi:Icc-related predicted phosphoesterase
LKILLVSDLHYALKQYDWMVASAERFNVVVIAGDHVDIAGQLEGNVQAVVLLKYFSLIAARTLVVVSSGNHDLDARDECGEKVASWMRKAKRLGIPADGDSIEIGDALISICPWWDGPAGRRRVHEQLARDAARRAGRWLAVYHAPPEHSPTSWNGRRSFGDPELSAWIDVFHPDVVLAGHIHEAPFKSGGSWVDRIGDTWVFNAGRQIGPIPAHIVIDTARNEASWYSLAGEEHVRLNGPVQRLDSLIHPAPGPSPV